MPDTVCGLGYREVGDILPFSFGELFGDSYCPIWFRDFYLWPLAFYQIWFLSYILLMTTYLRDQVNETTEDGQNVDGTAYGFLTNERNGKIKGVVKLLGDSTAAKIFMYWTINSLFICFTLILPMFMWSRFYLHTGILLFAASICVHNGSTFYVKVFSQGKDVPLLIKKLEEVGEKMNHHPSEAPLAEVEL